MNYACFTAVHRFRSMPNAGDTILEADDAANAEKKNTRLLLPLVRLVRCLPLDKAWLISASSNFAVALREIQSQPLMRSRSLAIAVDILARDSIKPYKEKTRPGLDFELSDLCGQYTCYTCK